MGLTSVSITGYRSIRTIRFPLRRLTVLVGGNGVGKTNLYRSLELLQSAALGTMAAEIAREGGLASVHFDGELKKHTQPALRLEATLGDLIESGEQLRYAVEARFPGVDAAAFREEAQIREEQIQLVEKRRDVEMMKRDGPSVWARDDNGSRMLADDQMLATETACRACAARIVRSMLFATRFQAGASTMASEPILTRHCASLVSLSRLRR